MERCEEAKKPGGCAAKSRQPIRAEQVGHSLFLRLSRSVMTRPPVQRAYKERVANLAPVADWLTGSRPKIGPVEVEM